MKPLLFGYQVQRLTTTQADLKDGKDALKRFAKTEGFTLGEIFVEHDVSCSALAALIEAARATKVDAIAVPHITDLGTLRRVQYLTRRRLELETHARVLVVQT